MTAKRATAPKAPVFRPLPRVSNSVFSFSIRERKNSRIIQIPAFHWACVHRLRITALLPARIPKLFLVSRSRNFEIVPTQLADYDGINLQLSRRLLGKPEDIRLEGVPGLD